MIELRNIEFSYKKGASPALSDVNAQIEPGIHLLAGENGAGKTTLLHVMAGIIRPDTGECVINGAPATSDLPADRARAFLLEENMYFPAHSIREFANIHARFYPGFSQERFDLNLEAFGLRGDERLRDQSLGNRKKAQLAYALALGTEVLLLDEPTNALDIEGRQTLRKMIAGTIGYDQTIVVSTHTVADLENLYDGALMLTKSRLLFAGLADAVSARIAFETGRIAPPDALYSEIQAGRVLSIAPASDDTSTRVDWRMLYSALHSPQRDIIANQLKQP